MHEHHRSPGNGWAKIAVTAVISVLVTSGAWNLLTQNKPDREEFQRSIRELREELRENQRETRRAISELNGKIDALNRLMVRR